MSSSSVCEKVAAEAEKSCLKTWVSEVDQADDSRRNEPLEGREQVLSQALAKTSAGGSGSEGSGGRRFDWRAVSRRLRAKWMELGPVPMTIILAAIIFPLLSLFPEGKPSKKPAAASVELTSNGYARFRLGGTGTHSVSDREMKDRLASEVQLPPLKAVPGSPRQTVVSAKPAPDRRPVQPSQHLKNASRTGGRPLSWFGPGSVVSTKSTDKNEVRTLPIGTRFRAHLEVGVSSSGIADVLARLDHDVQVNDTVVLHKGEMVLGKAGATRDNSRLMLDFSSVRGGARALNFRGYAVENGVPGLLAERHGGVSVDRGPSAAEKLGDFTKDVIGDVVSGSGSTLRAADRHFVQQPLGQNHGRHEANPAVVLSLPAQTAFEIIVSG